MSIDACAALVARADPDRFLAAMAAPLAARRVLLPLYAFNIEVARAPWVTQEPMIAEMRLQWWRDALEEIAAGGAVRLHEVVTPLAEVLDADAARILDGLVAARRWDIYRDAFEDAAAFEAHLDATTGGLTWVAARALGAPDEAAVRSVAWGSGLANWFLAIPALEAAGRLPLVDGTEAAVRGLAGEGLRRLQARASRRARPALLATWRATWVLRQARAEPGRVAAGHLQQPEFQRRASLLWRSLSWG